MSKNEHGKNTEAEGLRERKKRETYERIRQVSLRLALKKGLENITTEEISAAADIAPRTFFNYFATKEEAIVGDSTKQIELLSESITEAPPETPLLDVICGVLHKHLLSLRQTKNRAEVLKRQKLIYETPSLHLAQRAQFARYEHAIEEAIRARMRKKKEDPYPTLLAATSVSIMRLSFRQWAREKRNPEETLDQYFKLLKRGL